jgi:very-short-patch-repair endonuclease
MYRDNDQREFAHTLRNQPTDAERRLWHFLRAGQIRGRSFAAKRGYRPLRMVAVPT